MIGEPVNNPALLLVAFLCSGQHFERNQIHVAHTILDDFGNKDGDLRQSKDVNDKGNSFLIGADHA